MLAPLWDEGADLITKELAGKSVIVGKVDCDKHGGLGTKFSITKYPTIKYIRNGEVGKKEYRGQRSAEGFLEFVKEQIKDPVVEIEDLQELNNLDDSKAYVLGYFEQRGTQDHQNYRKAALSLKDSCQFYAGFGEVVDRMHPPSHDIVAFRPAKERSNDEDEAYTGELRNYDTFLAWVQEKCNPLVREITFENAEELTEEGLPFLILFHNPDDTESVREFNDLVKRELLGERSQVTFLTADGLKFAHPLHHLGKSKEDLPLIAIDSFRHMYLFPSYADTKSPGKVTEFLGKLYNGQLHREFHYGPDESDDPETNEVVVDATGHIPREDDRAKDRVKRSGPVDSTFEKLKPSDNRYSFKIRDEF
jgi:endoplasmic reticulum resident protein 44